MPSPFGVQVLEQPGTTNRPRETGQVLFYVGAADPADFVPGVPYVIRSLADLAETETADEDFGSFQLHRLARVYLRDYAAAPIVFVNAAARVEGDLVMAAADVAGGIVDGAPTGVEVLDTVFAHTGLVPTMLAADLSTEAAVQAALRAKAAGYGGGFKAMALLDVDPVSADVLELIADRRVSNTGLPPAHTSPTDVYCGPAVTKEVLAPGSGPDDLDAAEPLSWHVAAAIARAAAINGGLPFQSPSNQPLVGVTQPRAIYSPAEIDALRMAGLVTVQRTPSSWRLAGNRTGAYWNGEPTSATSEEALRDSFIPARMMANHLGNRLILDSLEFVDDPLSRAQIDRVLDGIRRLGNDLIGRGGSLGFAADFDEADNPATDLANGVVRFRLAFLPPVPMERIEWLVSVDLGYFSSLTD